MGYHDILRRSETTLRHLSVVCILGIFLAFSATPSAHAADLQVPVNESKAFMLDQPVSTVAVTNPAIADVTVHNEKTILVVGRTFGTTNLIALDADGKPVATKRIRVVSVPDSGSVTYVRGPGILSYSCAPRCERIALPSDNIPLPASE